MLARSSLSSSEFVKHLFGYQRVQYLEFVGRIGSMRIGCCWCLICCRHSYCWPGNERLGLLGISKQALSITLSSPDGSTSRYLGIQHMGVYPWVNVRIPMLVWVANRDKPIADTSGTLSISHDGNLVLSNYSGNFYTILNAQHPATSSSNTSATLLNTGNLVLRAAGKHIVWQSFDYPSDTWLAGMKLGLFKSSTGQLQNQFLTSWLSDQVPSMGAFTFGVDPNNTKQLVIWKRGVIYWQSGMWNGYNFTYFAQSYDIQFNFSYFSNEGQSYFTFTVNENKHSYWIDLRSVGIIGAVGISKELGSFPDISDAPIFCHPGQVRFRPINQGCVAPEPSNCTTGDAFIKTISVEPKSYDEMIYGINYSLGISDCEDICRRHCSCIAYSSGKLSGCSFFSDIEKSPFSAYILYIRAGFMVEKEIIKIKPVMTPQSTLDLSNPYSNWRRASPMLIILPPGNSKKRQLWLAIGGVVAFLVVTFLLYLWWKNPHFQGNNGRSKDETSQDTELLYEQNTEAAIIDDHELILFTLRSIEIATDYFSDANKLGQGGFGSVYKNMRIGCCWCLICCRHSYCWPGNERLGLLGISKQALSITLSSPDGSTSRYLGIQHMGVYPWVNVRIPMLVWVANRDKPIADTSGTLSISHDGNLVLSNYSGNFYTILNAQHPATSSSNTSATLLNTGNLVLRAAGKHIVWQSFDYPSDTWLAGMKLGLFKSSTGQLQNQFLTSWLSDQVPSMGAFTFGVDPNNTKQLVIWKRGVIYWQSGMWNGYNFTYFAQSYDIQFNFSYFSNEGQSYFTFTVNENKHSYWIDLRSVGIIGAVGISKELGSFPDISDAPIFCHPGQVRFRPINQGCVAPEPSNCTTGDAFIKTISVEPKSYDEMIYGINYSLGISDCEDICRRHCSCIAYSSGKLSGCSFFSDIEKSPFSAYILYIRAGFMVEKEIIKIKPVMTPQSTLDLSNPYSNWRRASPMLIILPPGNSKKRQLWLAIGGVVAFLVVTFLLYLWWKNPHFQGNNGRSKDETSQDTELLYEQNTEAAIIDDHELILFTLRSIEIATDYFSDANKLGQGGFGSVYKGKLVNGEEIAVKRLSISAGEGLREFKNEDKARRALLDWKMRVNIIEGIAQGLQYLHKYSRLRIIHRDLKTSNILLDDNMNPKISDFGTARIFGDNEAQANTKRIVGTYGYMSPEYALDGLFSVKSDVFSFGVMMLEIISGKKNTGFYQPDRALNLLGYAWDMWNEGRGLEIMDEVLVETCTSEVMRYIEVGFLCVQESAIDRPTISEVLSMLSNERSAIPTPKQPAFSAIIGVNNANRLEIPKPCSINDVTISEVKGR
ncbi:unnamed protein product [Camellia sinensis]